MAPVTETPAKASWLAVLLSYAGRCRGKMAVSLLCSVASVAAGLVPFYAVYRIIDEVIAPAPDGGAVLAWVGAAAAGYVASKVLFGASTLLSHVSAYTILESLRDDVVEKLMKTSLGTAASKSIGQIKNVFVDRIEGVEVPLAHMIPELSGNVLLAAAIAVWMALIDWRIALACLVTVPIGLVVFASGLGAYNRMYAAYMAEGNHVNSVMVEYVEGIQVIKAFGRTASSYGGFSTAVAEYHDSTLAWFKQSWVWMAAVKSVVPCTLLVSLPLGVWLMSAGQLTLPIFLTCIVIPLGFIAPLLKFAQAGGQISRMDVCLNVIWDFLGTPELVRPAERVRLDGESFAFENVSFSYHEGAEVLHGVSFETHPGQITAIVGPSGSGKSTVAKLMAGFWDATDGRVAFDGVDVRNIPYQQLMEHISYVAQDTFLFDRTLADNIRMGRPAASQVDVEAAARAAGCHEFISRLPQGYDTRAGEAGERLSGGEKQRIAIARAILKNAPIVILDEATAYADPENEALVERAISKLVVGKTLVTIAHRLSTVTGADQILVMDTGRIVARGTHDKLLECCPLYRRMWEQHRSSAVLRTAEPADAAASPGGTGETLADVSTTGDNDIKEAM